MKFKISYTATAEIDLPVNTYEQAVEYIANHKDDIIKQDEQMDPDSIVVLKKENNNKLKIRFTKNMIKTGIDMNLIKFVLDPIEGKGTMCKIGLHRFYFDNIYTESMDPKQFMEATDMDLVAEEVCYTLNSYTNSQDDIDHNEKRRTPFVPVKEIHDYLTTRITDA